MFKNNSGRWLTKALFCELTLPDNREHCLFTLKDDNHTLDGIEYVSLKKAFLACAYDPTEYEFANKYLGGWSHWKELQNTKDIAPLVEEWREERDVMLRSIGVKKMVEMAKSQEASFQAVQWLTKKGWEENTQKAGRPTKEQVKGHIAEEARAKKEVVNDFDRITKLVHFS